MQNTRWLHATRSLMMMMMMSEAKEEERQRAKIISSLRKRGKRRGVKKKVWSSSCGCFAVRCDARGDCLERWWWWCFFSVSMMTHMVRFCKIKSISLTPFHLLLLLLPLTTTTTKNKKKTMKRRRTFRLAYHSKHNTTTLYIYINYIIMKWI